MENVLRIKVEADDAARPTPDPRPNRILDEAFGRSTPSSNPPKPPTPPANGAAAAPSPQEDREGQREAKRAEHERIADFQRFQADARREARGRDQAERERVAELRRSDILNQQIESEERRERKKAEREAAQEKREEERAQKKAEAAEQKKRDFMGANATKGSVYAAQAASSGGGASQIAGGLSQVAQSGALGGQAAALAGGPVGAAALAGAAALDMVVDQMVKQNQKLQRGFQEAGEGVRAFIKDDLWTVARNRLDNYTKDLEEIPIVGKLYASRVKAAAEPFIQAKEIVDSFVARGRELSKYSGPASVAAANADVRTVLADLREGQKLGAKYAQLIDAQSRAETSLRDAFLPVKEAMITVVVPVLNSIADIADNVATMTHNAQQINDALRNHPFFKTFYEFVDNTQRAREQERAAKLAADARLGLQGLLNWGEMVDRMPGGPANQAIEDFDARAAQRGPIYMP